ncbi:hypothetical protein CLOM_g3982 [Closterium sp. NIES-68]|nr:hypothetical protein CLOM_g3982 [Closterium sp. NIES-68]
MFRVKYQASTSGSEPYLSTSPYLRHMRISPSDRLLILSSDGLYQHMQTRDVAKCLGPTLASFLPRPAASGSAHGGSGVSNLTRRLSLGGSIRFGSKKWMGKGVGEERGGWGRDGEGGTGGSGLAGSTSGGGGSDSAGVAVAAAGAAGETGGAWDQNGIGKSGSSTNSSTLQATSHSSSNTIISTASCTISQSTSNSTTSSSNIAQMLVRDALERAAKQAGTDPSSSPPSPRPAPAKDPRRYLSYRAPHTATPCIVTPATPFTVTPCTVTPCTVTCACAFASCPFQHHPRPPPTHALLRMFHHAHSFASAPSRLPHHDMSSSG